MKTAAKNAAAVKTAAFAVALKEIEKVRSAALETAEQISHEYEKAAKRAAVARARSLSSDGDDIELKRAVGEIRALTSVALQTLPHNLSKRMESRLGGTKAGAAKLRLPDDGFDNTDGFFSS